MPRLVTFCICGDWHPHLQAPDRFAHHFDRRERGLPGENRWRCCVQEKLCEERSEDPSSTDTGARHKASNSFCQIGNAQFASSSAPAGSKSRLNFLELLRAGHGDCVINARALSYMRTRALAGPIIVRLAGHVDHAFADRVAWNAHLDRLGISALTVNPDPVLIATEGALWGSIKAHGLLTNTVIVSDDAGQFKVGEHGLCWVHAERLVHKLDTFADAQRAAQQRLRALIWRFYGDLKAYRGNPAPARRAPAKCPSRLHLSHIDRHRQSRPVARTAERSSTRTELLRFSTFDRDPVAHQRLGARHPLSRHQTQDQWRNPQRCRSRAARDAFLEASTRPAQSSASHSGIISAQGSPFQVPPQSHL